MHAIPVAGKLSPAKPLPVRVLTKASRLPIVPLAVLGLFVLVSTLGPYLAPHSPIEPNLAQPLRPPMGQDGAYVLGTDRLGRDILSRIIWGGRISLLVIVATIPLAGTIGVAMGLLGGYRGGWTEALVMRLIDIKLSLPTVILALVFAVVWGPSFTNVVVLVILTLWAVYGRTVHAETLALKQRDYVLAARALGASDLRIVLVHILPGLVNTIVILASLQIAQVVLLEASLSFLGIGIPPPTPAWGLMIAEGRNTLSVAWWVSTMPGIALSLVVLSANLTGDWLRDYLDPTLRHIER